MVKIIHCPTFAEKLFGVIDNIGNVGPSTNALLLSVYYTAVSTCTAAEARRRFGESQEELMQRYGRYFESAIRHSFDAPTLEALQALVLYMVSSLYDHRHCRCDGKPSDLLRLCLHRSQIKDTILEASNTFSNSRYARRK